MALKLSFYLKDVELNTLLDVLDDATKKAQNEKLEHLQGIMGRLNKAIDNEDFADKEVRQLLVKADGSLDINDIKDLANLDAMGFSQSALSRLSLQLTLIARRINPNCRKIKPDEAASAIIVQDLVDLLKSRI